MSNDYDDDEDDGDEHHQTIEERIKEAISCGYPDEIKAWLDFSKLNGDKFYNIWNDFFDKGETLGKILEGPYLVDEKGVQDACLVLINCAVKDGRTDIFDCYTTDFDRQQILQPLHDLVNHGFDRVLLRFLDAGFMPEQPLRGSGLIDATAISMADRLGQPATAAMFRAHVARRVADKALFDLDNSSGIKASP